MNLFTSSIDIYNAVLVEIDKPYAPSFEDYQYKYFINKSILEYIKLKYKEFELTQKRTDDLQSILDREKVLQLKGNKSELPNDYLFLLGVFKKTNEFCLEFEQPCYKTTTDKKGYDLNNYYAKTKTFYEISNNKIYILGNELSDVRIEYIKQPSYQDLDLDNPQDIKNNLIPLLRKDYIVLEVIKICISLFLENIETQRTKINLELNNNILTN